MIKWRNICKGYPKFIFEKFIFGLKNPLIYANLISGQISVTPDFMEWKSHRLPPNKKVRSDNMKEQSKFFAAMYLRLSRDDNVKAEHDGNAMINGVSKAESNSIGSQRELIRSFLNEQEDIELYDIYVDDGFSGSNFDRPEFNRMMKDIEAGRVNCVVVKDLSRFGRDYIEAGRYLEKIFPVLGVRFIALTDHYDSISADTGERQIVIPVKNFINDSYCRDISTKVKSQLAVKRKAGECLSPFAVYGYRKSPENKNKLVVDDYAAEIVRRIFRWKIEGMAVSAIAKKLNELHILSPKEYKKSTGLNYRGGFTGGSGSQWSSSSVKRILTNEVYLGHLLQGKTEKVNYKVKKSVEKPKEEWVRAENTHEPIISDSDFEAIIKSDTYAGKLVQGKTSITARDENNRIHKPEDDWVVKEKAHEPLITPEIGKEAAGVRKKLREQTKSHAHPTEGCPIGENIFDKVLYCGVCGRKMTRHSYVKHYADDSKNRMDGYFCRNGGATKTDNCPSSNRISKNALTDILFVLFEKEFDVDLKKQRMYLDTARAIIRQKKQELEQSLHAVVCTKLRLAEEESGKYMAYRMGNLSQKDYVEYKMCKENRLRDLEKQESSFKEQEVSLERDGETYLKAVRALIKLKNEQVLTKELIETLIDKIYVYPWKRVEVLFTYSDALVERQVKK